MNDRAVRQAIKNRLPRTWAAFFERHGNFTPIQVSVIPPILDGRNVIVCAPTASGKTEAAVAPLIERYDIPCRSGLILLYITPTRALANDLLKRLSQPLEMLNISVSIKTRDQNTFCAERPASIVITTPESVDSLLSSRARVFTTLRAIVLDELHLFDSTPRGDQLRALLNRLRRIREYSHTSGETRDPFIQYVALSATLDNPQSIAQRYFADSLVIHREDGKRLLEAEFFDLHDPTGDELHDYLATFRARGWRKALAFCNSRAEVETYAALVRKQSPFGSAVYVHYSNIATHRRREIETEFARAEAAICFATSTLELGIDIGDIDTVILIGPPGDRRSFAQRIGRGNRRGNTVRAACFFRSPLEELIFKTLCSPNTESGTRSPELFRPSVAIQQIFSLIKQNPSGAVRLPELCDYFKGLLTPDDIKAILGELQTDHYLQPGRPGEWKPDQRLNNLVDWQTSASCPLSIYSNIANQSTTQVEIRDQHTHKAVAYADAQWLSRPVLTLEGREVHIEWVDGEAIWVTPYRGTDMPDHLKYRSAQHHLSYELARQIPITLGLHLGDAPFLITSKGWCLFHWLGDVYGHVFLDLLRRQIRVARTTQPSLYILLPEKPMSSKWLSWTDNFVTAYLEQNYQTLERWLDVGPFQSFLPTSLRRRSVIEQFNVARFLEAIASLRLLIPPDRLISELSGLLQG